MEDGSHPPSSIHYPLVQDFVNSLRAFAAACGLVVLGGCALQYNARTLGVPVTMAEELAVPVAGDSFNITTSAVHVFWGLAVAKEPSLHQALAGQLAAGGSVHNLAIRSRKRWSDLLVTVLTLGFVSSTSVTYSGVVARAATGTGP
jgi:hypothetical protein